MALQGLQIFEKPPNFEGAVIRQTNTGGYIIQEPAQYLDPITFLLILPFLPLYLLSAFLYQQLQTRRVRITEIERTESGGWRIFEYEG